MKQFLSVKDVANVHALAEEAIAMKKAPYLPSIGQGKTMGLLFFNPSLRTRLSTQKAASNLGINILSINIKEDAWQLEWQDGTVMDQGNQEHIKDAIKVISQYVDILGVRSFASLTDKEADYAEHIMQQIQSYTDLPMVSLESATLHPLQSLADLITIKEQQIEKPKVVLSWAPHPKALPQAVPNSFAEWMLAAAYDVHIVQPKGYELSNAFTKGATIHYNQEEAFAGADFIYAKNWSSFSTYGKNLQLPDVEKWIIDEQKMKLTNNGKFMHCLPIRRNVIASDKVIDDSLVYQQANNRTFSAQVVLKKIVEAL